jgi:Taurine catabolism dioxygenase TauD, TfdA family
MNFGRASLLGNAAHPRSADLPSINASQREALDTVEAIAIANQFEFATQLGDIHFINNLAVLHRREDFTDSEADGKRRHLVRMRLRNASEGWSIPAELKAFWDEAFSPKGKTAWHIEPMPEGFFPLRLYPN